MQIERQSLLDGNVPVDNPVVVEAKDQIEKLRVSLLENLANIKRSYLKTITTLRQNSGQANRSVKKPAL